MNSFSIVTFILAVANLLLASLAASPLPEGALLLVMDQGVLIGAYVHSETYDYGERTLGVLIPSLDFGGWAPAVAETIANLPKSADVCRVEDALTQRREDSILVKQTAFDEFSAHTQTATPTVQPSSSTLNNGLATRSFAKATTTHSFAAATTSEPSFSQPTFVPIATQSHAHFILTVIKNIFLRCLCAYSRALILVRVTNFFYTDSAPIAPHFYCTLLTTNPIITVRNLLFHPNPTEFYITAVYVLTFGFYFELSFRQCSWLLIIVFFWLVVPFLTLVSRHEKVRPTKPKRTTKMNAMDMATWLSDINVEEMNFNAFSMASVCHKYKVEEPEVIVEDATSDQSSSDDIYIEVLEEDDGACQPSGSPIDPQESHTKFDISTSAVDSDSDLLDHHVAFNTLNEVLDSVQNTVNNYKIHKNNIDINDQHQGAWVSDVEESDLDTSSDSGTDIEDLEPESMLETDSPELQQELFTEPGPIFVNPRYIPNYVDPDMFARDMLDSDEDIPGSTSTSSSSVFSDNGNVYHSRYGDDNFFADDSLIQIGEGNSASPSASPLDLPTLYFNSAQEQDIEIPPTMNNYENYHYQVVEAHLQINQPADAQYILVDVPNREDTPDPVSPTPSDEFWAPSSGPDSAVFNGKADYRLEPLPGVFDDNDDGHDYYDTPSPPPTTTCPDITHDDSLLPLKRLTSDDGFNPHKKQRTRSADGDRTLVAQFCTNTWVLHQQLKANEARLTKRVTPNPEAPGQGIGVVEVIEAEPATQTPPPKENLLDLFFPNLKRNKELSVLPKSPYTVKTNIFRPVFEDIFVVFEEDP